MNEDDAKQLFEEAVQGLDPATGNRLRRARRAALDGPAPRAARAAWAPALAAAVVVAVGLAWWLPRTASPGAPTQAARTGAPELVDFDEADDAEFYEWLAEAPVAADQAGGSL